MSAEVTSQHEQARAAYKKARADYYKAIAEAVMSGLVLVALAVRYLAVGTRDEATELLVLAAILTSWPRQILVVGVLVMMTVGWL